MSTAHQATDSAPAALPLIRRLLDEQFPQYSELPLRAIPSPGIDHDLYRIGTDLLLRLPRHSGALAGVERERRWLPVLGAHLPLTVPTPVAQAVPTEDFSWEWSVHRWIDGTPPAPGEIGPAFVDGLAEFLLALRDVPTADAPVADRAGALAEHDEPTRAALFELGGLVDVASTLSLWNDVVALPGWTGPPTWVHGDLRSEAVLVRDGAPTAVVDFGRAGVGDPAADLVVAWSLLPAALRPRFHDALGVDEATWARGRGWALSRAVRLLPREHAADPAAAARAQRVLHDIRTEHDR